MNKHTPGPWTITESATHITVRNREGDAVFHDDKRLDGVLGDAHLIAAAPDLLEALTEIVSVSLRYRLQESDSAVEAARAAIAKARGGEL
jgi:hypothetical protein